MIKVSTQQNMHKSSAGLLMQHKAACRAYASEQWVVHAEAIKCAESGVAYSVFRCMFQTAVFADPRRVSVGTEACFC